MKRLTTLACALSLNCSSDHIGNPADCDYGDALVRLAPGAGFARVCGALEANGRDEFETISDAIAASADIIVVAKGVYPEAVQITAGVQIVGAGTETRIRSSSWGVEVRSADAVKLENLLVEDASGIGIAQFGGTLDLLDVTIDGTRSENGGLGHGVVVQDGGALTMRSGAVTSSAGIGLLGEASAFELAQVDVRGNQGGVKIDGGFGSLDNVSASANGGYAIAFVDAAGAVIDASVTSTVVGEEQRGGDGLVIASRQDGAPEAMVEVTRGTFEKNARFGVIVDGTVGVDVASARIAENGGGGVWVQVGDATARRAQFTDNLIEDNVRVGMVATRGARVALSGNTVRGTQLGSFIEAEVGDGLGIYGDADAIVEANTIAASARAGAVFDGSRADFNDNTVDEDRLAVVSQSGAQLAESGTVFDGAADEIVERAMGDELPVFSMPALLEGL